MLKIFESIKDLAKPINFKNSTDGKILRLYYPATTAVLLVLCVLVCSRQFLGGHIHCIQGEKGDKARVNEKVLNTYCFIQSTFTLPEEKAGYRCDQNIPAHPGIRPYVKGGEKEKYHAYYQWVPFVLFFQAATFLIPHFYWSQCEGGLINRLYSCLSEFEVTLLPPKPDEKKKEEKKDEKKKVPVYFEKYDNEETEKCKGEGDVVLDVKNNENKEEKPQKPKMLLIAEYFINSRKTHQYMAFAWFACDYVALIVVVANFWLTNVFLGGDFSNYGLEIFGLLSNDPIFSNGCTDAADKTFPKITKCTFYKYGASGTIENIDAMCILALNIMNEKIYAFLYVWFIVLLIVTVLGIIYKLIILLHFFCLSKQQRRIFPGITQKMLGAPITLPSKDFQVLRGKFGISDWIFFSLFIEKLSLWGYKKFVHCFNNLNKSIDFSEVK